MKPLSVVDTGEYAEVIQREDEEIAKVQTSATNATAMTDIFTRLAVSETSRNSSIAYVKAKVKTRPSAPHEASAGEEEHESEADNPIGEQAIPVNSRAHAIFMQMYPKTVEEMSQTVVCDDFVSAMYSAGCMAQNSAGSAVSFEDTLYKKGRIVFHKPYPTPKVDSFKFRKWGRRLMKWFGWHRDRFVLHDDQTAPVA
jgi:hypothetical protein